jgi:hypothetical protein
MTGDERVRYCPHCRLNVFNLSEMGRTEAEELVAQATGRLCVRYYQRSDGTVMTQDCPGGPVSSGKGGRLAWVLGALFVLSLGAGFGVATLSQVAPFREVFSLLLPIPPQPPPVVMGDICPPNPGPGGGAPN